MDKRTVLEQIDSFEEGRPGIGSCEGRRNYERYEWHRTDIKLVKALEAVGITGWIDNPERHLREDGSWSWIAHPSNMRYGTWLDNGLIMLRLHGFDYRKSALSSAYSREHFEVEIFELEGDTWAGSAEKMRELIDSKWFPLAKNDAPDRIRNQGYLI